MKRILTVCLLIVCLNTSATGYDSSRLTNLAYGMLEKGVPLTDNWVYHPGDNPQWASPVYDDRDWKIVSSTMLEIWLTDSNKRTDFKNIGWFRLHVNISDSALDVPIALGLEQYGASEIFFDGKKIGGYGTISKDNTRSRYYDPSRLPLMITVDTPGHHLIAIRYANYRSTTGNVNELFESLGFTVYAGFGTEMGEQVVHNVVSSSLTHLMLAGFFLALCFAHFVLWLYHRKDKANLFFSIFSLATASFLFTSYLEDIPLDSTLYNISSYINYAATLVLFIALSGLNNYLFSKNNISFYLILALGLVCIVLSLVKVKEMTVTLMLMLFLAGAVFESVVLTIIAIVRKKRGARIVGVGVLLFILLAVAFIIALAASVFEKGDYIATETPGTTVILLALGSILSIPVSMSVYLAWNFANIHKTIVIHELEKQHLLETQNERLEQEVKERTREIASEKQKSDELLLNILPEEIAEELKQKGSSGARYYDNVTVMFTDFVDFTKAGTRLTPEQLVNELDTCFKAFDEITARYQIEKIKTIGDAYLCVCGLPVSDQRHAQNTVSAALEIMDFMKARKQQLPETAFDIRIGIHSGTVVAGIVGLKKFAYDIWGDTVNTAARMESSSDANRVNISHATYELVQEEFACTYRGEISAKNKGDLQMYFVEGRK